MQNGNSGEIEKKMSKRRKVSRTWCGDAIKYCMIVVCRRQWLTVTNVLYMILLVTIIPGAILDHSKHIVPNSDCDSTNTQTAHTHLPIEYDHSGTINTQDLDEWETMEDNYAVSCLLLKYNFDK